MASGTLADYIFIANVSYYVLFNAYITSESYEPFKVSSITCRFQDVNGT